MMQRFCQYAYKDINNPERQRRSTEREGEELDYGQPARPTGGFGT